VSIWEAPAKLNLSLELRPPDDTGLHPLRSLVQTIERYDLLSVTTGDDERLTIVGSSDLSDGEDNLVWKAVRALVGHPDRPRLDMTLSKSIPEAAGLGGGSSDAAAALRAAAAVYKRSDAEVRACAPTVGADVSFLLDGGTAWMEGNGEQLTEERALGGFCVAVAVPHFRIATAEAYRRWDEMDGPIGRVLEDRQLPPALRDLGPLRNDLTPAALSLEPELGDWVADISQQWERPLAMTGSGSAHFAYFLDMDEATAAAAACEGARVAFAATLRNAGVCAR
jgi:4-diphosphocytidyl-2-C-methyl-D-erythritol kinase